MPFSTGELIGRDSDLIHLAGALGVVDSPVGSRGGVTEGWSGTGGLAILSGDAGIGKSRLLAQLTADAAELGWLTIMGHCVGQAGSSLAYLPFVELISALGTLEPDVVAQVLTSHPSLSRLLPRRGGDVDPSDSASEANPGLVAESVHALFTALGAVRPTLLVFEDVHWADHSSRDLLTLLLTRGFSTSVALAVSYRTDDLHRGHPLQETLAVWDRIPQVEHIELAPLTDASVGRLVTGINGVPDDAATIAEITRRAEGNPFFAEELAASAAAGRPVTGGLSRVLRARIEQLDETTQRVVRAVALKGGRTIGHELLSRVVGLPEDQLEAALADAVEHHVLEGSWPPAYTFRHALLGETAAAGLLPGERLRLHKAYAAVLAECPHLGPASELARHAAASGDLGAAVTASLEAAESAMARGGPHDALQHLERALDWLAEEDALRDEVTLRAAAAAMAAGNPLRAVGLLKDRLDHPGPGQPPGVRAELLASYASRSRLLDLPVDGLALTTQAVGLLGPELDERRVRVLIAHLQQLIDARSWAPAVRLGDEVTALAERLDLRQELTEIRMILTRVIEAQQDLDAVESYLEHLLRDVVDADDRIQVRLLHQLASVSHRRGDLPGALARYDEGARLALRLRREWAPWGMDCRLIGALTAYELGDFDGALRRLQVIGRAPKHAGALFEAAGLVVAASRGDAIDATRLQALREWWPVDGQSVVLTVMPGVDLLGDQGDLRGVLDLAEEAVATLDQAWGKYHAIVRLAALVTAQAATLWPRAEGDVRLRAADTVERLWLGSAQLVAKVVRAIKGMTHADAAAAAAAAVAVDPASAVGLADVDLLEPESRETWAWARRLEAERLRYAWLTGAHDGPSAERMVEAWTISAGAFDLLGHVYEGARSRARLAAALRAAGDEAGARAAAARARETAERLGARPLLAELDAILPHPSAASDLTPRELEVLALVARGLSNGQIGKHLYISTKTVSVHVSNVLAKLGASGRTQAAAIAHDRALIP